MNQSKPSEENLTIQDQLNIQQQALAKIYQSVEKTRKYIFWTGIISLVFFILPLIAVAVLLPTIINTFTSNLGTISDVSEITETLSDPSLRESLKSLEKLGF